MYYMPFIATMVHFPNQKENQGPSSIKRIERLNLDGFEKLLASVIQKELPVISVPKLTIAQRTAISIFSISLNNSRRSFLSNPVNPEILYINFAKLVQMTETTK